jgi:hypothetical protein
LSCDGRVANRRTHIRPGAICLAFAIFTNNAGAQTPEQVRRALLDLRDDKIPRNCEHATEWLFKNREQLKTELIDELDKTDWQGRDAICHILWKTTSFQPDERFVRHTLQLLRDDEISGNADEAVSFLKKQGDKIQPLLIDELSRTDSQGREGIFKVLASMPAFTLDDSLLHHLVDQMVGSSTNDDDWRFIHDHFDQLEPVLAEAIAKSKNGAHDMYILWSTTWVIRKRGELDRYATLFTPAVMKAAAVHLRSDNEPSNAGWAVRFFLLLGDRSLDTLREVAQSSDPQARNFASAVTDALAGRRNAFGFLQARVELSRTPFGPEVEDPPWLDQVTSPYRDNKKPYQASN